MPGVFVLYFFSEAYESRVVLRGFFAFGEPVQKGAKGLNMKKLIFSTIAAGVLATSAALAADMVTKAPPMMPAPSNPWDLAFGGGLTSDYIFRGITQSDHKPSVHLATGTSAPPTNSTARRSEWWKV